MQIDNKQRKEFWKNKTLEQMSDTEWESLCDGCAKCCVFKFEEEETGNILQTDVVCKLLNLENCSCIHYGQRKELVPDCISITAENILQLKWMPASCSYRLIAQGMDLPEWHPLLTGDRNSTQKAQMTVQGNVISEAEVKDVEERIIGWFDPHS